MFASGFIYFIVMALVSMTGIITLFLALNRRSYQHYLDKRIAEHSLGKKDIKAFSPLRTALLVLLGAFLALILTFSSAFAITAFRLAADDSVLSGVSVRQVRDEAEIPVLKGHTAEDELPGYNRYTAYNGYDTLIYYLAKEPNATSPQMLFYLETDLPRYKYEFNFDSGGNRRFATTSNVAVKETGNKWWCISFPFSFSETKKYHSSLQVTVNGDEILWIPTGDIAAGTSENSRTYNSMFAS